jgi:hypothetical protein
MPTTGSNLGLQHGWALGESGWNAGMDANLKMLDAVTQLSVLDRDLTAPPGSPTAGDRYIVGASATGAWSGKDGQIARWNGTAWEFYAPKKNWLCVVDDEDKLVRCTAVSPITWSAGIAL